MKERPILFNGKMVRAILEGRKTQTRRPIDPQPGDVGEFTSEYVTAAWQDGFIDVKCPFGWPGHRLWVRETFEPYCEGRVLYRADGESQVNNIGGTDHRWRPSIHMPRSACRILLEITNIRVERVNEICAHDSLSEGVTYLYSEDCPPDIRAIESFVSLWNSVYGGNTFHGGGPYAWKQNPWVWVIEFKRLP